MMNVPSSCMFALHGILIVSSAFAQNGNQHSSSLGGGSDTILPAVMPQDLNQEGQNDRDWTFWRSANQCAAWVVYHAVQLRDGAASLSTIDSLLPADGRKKSLLQVKDALSRLGFGVTGVKLTKSLLMQRPRCLIVALPYGHGNASLHFVFVAGWTDDNANILDGPFGLMPLKKEKLLEAAHPICLALSAQPGPIRKFDRRSGSLFHELVLPFCAGLAVGAITMSPCVWTFAPRRFHRGEPDEGNSIQ